MSNPHGNIAHLIEQGRGEKSVDIFASFPILISAKNWILMRLEDRNSSNLNLTYTLKRLKNITFIFA